MQVCRWISISLINQYMVYIDHYMVYIFHKVTCVEMGMFILKGVLRAETQEKILIYLLLRGSGYGKSIAEFYGIPTNPVQKQLARLEIDGVVVSEPVGRVRNYQLNPRYPFMAPLQELLKAAVLAYPQDVIQALMVQRKRPRQPGKSLTLTSDKSEQTRTL